MTRLQRQRFICLLSDSEEQQDLGVDEEAPKEAVWSTEWVEADPVEMGMERDWQANLAAEEEARAVAEDWT